MKITILLLSALCLALASARTIPKQGILVDFKVSSAQLNVPIQAILKVYILDAPSTLQVSSIRFNFVLQNLNCLFTTFCSCR